MKQSETHSLKTAGHLEEPGRGILLMSLASLSFSGMGMLSKILSAGLPPMEVAFFRALGTVILIVPWMLAWRVPMIGKNRVLLFFRSAAGFLSLNFTFYAIAHIRLSEASILFNTSVLFVPALSGLLLRERTPKIILIFMCLGFLGALFVLKPGAGILHGAGLSALCAGLFSALVYVAIRELHNSNSFLTIIFNFSAISCLLSLLIFGRTFILPDASAWWPLIGVGVTGTLGQLFMTYSYKLAPASIVSPFMFLGVGFGMIWDISIWSAYPDAFSLVGISLIVGSGIGILRHRRNAGPSPAAPSKTSS